MKTTNKTLFVVLPLAAAVNAAWAQAASDEYTTLDTSVVSAAGYSQDVREAPASVSVIPAQELQTKPVRDLGTAIGDIPGVDLDSTKMGNSTISIRGFDAGYTLILQDGRRQNFSSAIQANGFDPTTAFIAPVGMIERIEVLRGPASTVWGTDAVGGVVNVITKKHVKELTGSVTAEGTFQEHRKSYGNSGAGSFFFGIPLVDESLSLMLRGRYYRHEDTGIMNPKGAYAGHSPSESYTSNVGARLNWSVNPQNFTFADFDFTRFSGGSMNTSSRSIKAQQWYHKYNLTLGHEGKYGFGRTESYLMWNNLSQMKTKTTLTPHSTKKARASENHGSFSDPLKQTNTYTFATKAIMPFDFDRFGSMSLTAGVEANYEDYENPSTSTASQKGPFDQTTLSVFAEGEYFINDELNATVGARYQWSDMFDANVSPRAYLVYKPAQWLSFKGGVAAGYKTPNVKQVVDGYYDGSEPGDRSWGNPNLKPEESWSYEFSTTVDLGRAAQVTLGGFYTDFKNLIASEERTEAGYCNAEGSACDKRLINHGKVRAKGIEVLFKTAKFAGFSFTGGYTLTDAKITAGADSGKRPNELPRHSLQLRADYQQGPLSAYVKSTSKWDMICNNSRTGIGLGNKYKDYTIVDVGATYVVAKNHRFSVAVNNVLDKDTVEWTETSPGRYGNLYRQYLDGRNFWVSYTYDF